MPWDQAGQHRHLRRGRHYDRWRRLRANLRLRRGRAGAPAPLVGKALLRPEHVPLVRSVLDLAADALPMRLVARSLQQHLESEPQRRVAELFLAQHVDSAVDVLPWNRGLELFEAHEILFIKGAESIDGDLQLPDQLFCVDPLHGAAHHTKATARP